SAGPEVSRRPRQDPDAPGFHPRAGTHLPRACRRECKHAALDRHRDGARRRRRRAIREGVMETVQEVAPSSPPEERTDLCLCVTYLRATERAALAGARWLGRADHESAAEAAVSGMRS